MANQGHSQLSASATLPLLTGAATLSSVAPASVASAAGVLPALTGAATLSTEAPEAGAATATVTLPALTGAATLSTEVEPATIEAVSVTLPALTGAATIRTRRPLLKPRGDYALVVSFAEGATRSSAANLRGCEVIGLIVPGDFAGTVLTLHAGPEADYLSPLRNAFGGAFTLSVVSPHVMLGEPVAAGHSLLMLESDQAQARACEVAVLLRPARR